VSVFTKLKCFQLVFKTINRKILQGIPADWTSDTESMGAVRWQWRPKKGRYSYAYRPKESRI